MVRCFCPALLATVLAGPALTQVTPEEVWQDLQGVAEQKGATLTGAMTETGGGLEVAGATLAWTARGAPVLVTLPGVRLAQTESGVQVILPESFPIGLSWGETELSLGVTLEEITLGIEGWPGDLIVQVEGALARFAMAYPGAGILAWELELPDVELSAFLHGGTDEVGVETLANFGPVRLMLSGPGVSAAVEMDSLSTTTAVLGPVRWGPFSDTVPWLEAGGFGSATVVAVAPSVTVASEGLAMGPDVTIEAEGISLDALLDQDQAVAGVRGTGVMLGSSFGPVMEAVVLESRMWGPVLPSNEPQPFGFQLDLMEFSPSPLVWNLYDGDEALVRDPMDLSLYWGEDILGEDSGLMTERQTQGLRSVFVPTGEGRLGLTTGGDAQSWTINGETLPR